MASSDISLIRTGSTWGSSEECKCLDWSAVSAPCTKLVVPSRGALHNVQPAHAAAPPQRPLADEGEPTGWGFARWPWPRYSCLSALWWAQRLLPQVGPTQLYQALLGLLATLTKGSAGGLSPASGALQAHQVSIGMIHPISQGLLLQWWLK